MYLVKICPYCGECYSMKVYDKDYFKSEDDGTYIFTGSDRVEKAFVRNGTCPDCSYIWNGNLYNPDKKWQQIKPNHHL